MHLRSISMKGFKSFPDRTKLEFAPGVSVIVGPNGSGKSNITDAVLWALGEQSPLAVRGQTMQDVIFAGGAGLPSRNVAEVEVVIEDFCAPGEAGFSELSITRRLDRSGEGEYRVNGARCRLVDVLEVLSDTGLGKEMHSVVSQGRVESIIHSKPRDRRLLIEEAAGLGKHRKRRRRAQLKLERTEQNLSRALDVEREARSRLRPLKRQAEAAELHERIERQSLEAGFGLARDAAREVRARLERAEAEAAAAGSERDEAERLLASVAARREAAEETFASHSQAREKLSARAFAAGSAAERIADRLDRIRELGQTAEDDAARARAELELIGQGRPEAPAEGGSPRVQELERELAGLDAERDRRAQQELESLRTELDDARRSLDEHDRAAEERRGALRAAEEASQRARSARRDAERSAEAARSALAGTRAELAAVDHFLRGAGAALGGARTLAEELGVEPGYEAAVAAVLGGRLRAGIVENVREGLSLLDSAGSDGGAALLASGGAGAEASRPIEAPPGGERLLDRVSPAAGASAPAERLLRDAWVVEDLDGVPEGFAGVAVTRSGRVLSGATGELRQAPVGGDERLLEQRNRRERLAADAGRGEAAEAEARAAAERVVVEVAQADGARDEAEAGLRDVLRQRDEAAETARRAEWLIERRREAPEDGPVAVRRAELSAAVRAERLLEERAERERAARERRRQALASSSARASEISALAERAAAAVERAHESVAAQRAQFEHALQADQAIGERTAAELRECAREEADLQGRLRRASEAVTQAEVRAQQVRDAAAEATTELLRVAGALGLPAEPAAEPLDDEERLQLEARIERLARRRDSLGPVNPLAKQEYDEAVAHVEDLERHRADLEAALTELKGLIRETDRRIRESFETTFEAAARNFEELVQHLFPGGRGRLRLVQPDGPRAVIGGESPDGEAPADDSEDAAEAEEEPPVTDPGVEVEVTPAGKSTKRLSLLSGGEKSLVALAFMFAVFLARPCPFYILDEVEAALDDINIDRFLDLVGRYADRAQFLVVTHQKRTMDAADCLYGVSMGEDGVSKVVSRRMSRDAPAELADASSSAAA